MRLRRFLDAEFERGRHDALYRGRPNPSLPEADAKYSQWAYNAGYSAGLSDVEALRRQLDPPQPRDPSRRSA
jgi:hypothetical protein